MSLPYELRIGLRYTRAGRRARRRNAFISFISAVSMAGIALGVAALIVVLSVMNGFQKNVRDRMLAVLSHVEITSFDGSLPDWRGVVDRVARDREVVASAPYVQAQGLFTRGDAVRGTVIRGIDPQREPAVSDVTRMLMDAQLAELVPGQFNIVLGIELARALHVKRGDKVTLIAAQGRLAASGVAPRLRQFDVIGTLASGHFEFDSTLALVNIEDAQQTFGLTGPTGIRLRLTDLQHAPLAAARISRVLNQELIVRDWTRQNRTWFAALQTQKRMMAIILTLIVAVAAFNLVATLVMTVTEKQADIAILRTLGASPRGVMSVFVVQGVLIGVIGTLLGVGCGLLIASNLDVIVPVIEAVAGVRFLPPEIYLIDTLPSDPRAADIVPVALISMALSLVATLYPSWRAARLRPAEALRYD